MDEFTDARVAVHSNSSESTTHEHCVRRLVPRSHTILAPTSPVTYKRFETFLEMCMSYMIENVAQRWTVYYRANLGDSGLTSSVITSDSVAINISQQESMRMYCDNPMIPGNGLHYWEILPSAFHICKYGVARYSQRLTGPDTSWTLELQTGRWCIARFPGVFHDDTTYYVTAYKIPYYLKAIKFLYDSNRGRLMVFLDREFCCLFTRLPAVPLSPYIKIKGSYCGTFAHNRSEAPTLLLACRNVIASNCNPSGIYSLPLPHKLTDYLSYGSSYPDSEAFYRIGTDYAFYYRMNSK